MMPGRFSLAYISTVASDVVDERGVTVGTIATTHGEDGLLLNGEAIGRLSGPDLYALAEVLRLRVIEREYGS